MLKRKRKSNDPNNTGSSSQKRPCPSTNSSPPIISRSISYGRVDPTYGQRSAIPGLDEYSTYSTGDQVSLDIDSDLEYDVDADALSYLRSVRTEANSIPTLLIAPKVISADSDDIDRTIYENGVGDSRGWYEDGAYTAAPTEVLTEASEASTGGEGRGRDPQELYYESLLGRFSALRARLARAPPVDVVKKLDSDHVSSMSNSVEDFRMWQWRLRNTDPAPAQLTGMDKGTVLRLLRMMGDNKGKFLQEEDRLGGRRTGLWIWGLLARLPEPGELLSEEVGIVRELGKRAVWVGVELKGVDMGRLQKQMEVGEERGGHEDEDIVDVEVDGEDDEPDLEEIGENTDSTKRDDRVTRTMHHNPSDSGPQGSTLLLGPDASPIISPSSPESLNKQLSPQANITGINKEQNAPTNKAEEREDPDPLSAARARLIARLESHTLPPSSMHFKAWTEPDQSDEETGLPSEPDVSEDRKEPVSGPEEGECDDDEHSVTSNSAEGNGEENEENEHSALQATKMLLDMIITVAGEVYGQRDLLEFRESW